jgi:hypothetical protein
MDSQAQMPERLTIKNYVIKYNDVLGFIAAGILFYIVLKLGFYYWTLIPIIFSIYLIFTVLNRLRDRESKLVIDNNGIEFSDQKKCYKWSEINYAFIERNGGGHNSFEQNNYLHIVLTKSEVTIGLKKLAYSEKAIERQIEYYLGKDKCKPQDKFNSEIKGILIDKEKHDEVMVLFSKQKTLFLWSGLLIVFGLSGLSIYFQINSAFPYVFAFGFVITVITMFVYIKIINTRFRKSTIICNLTEKEFDAISIKYELKKDNDKKRKMLGYIFLIVLTVLIFTISYFVTK